MKEEIQINQTNWFSNCSLNIIDGILTDREISNTRNREKYLAVKCEPTMFHDFDVPKKFLIGLDGYFQIGTFETREEALEFLNKE